MKHVASHPRAITSYNLYFASLRLGASAISVFGNFKLVNPKLFLSSALPFPA